MTEPRIGAGAGDAISIEAQGGQTRHDRAGNLWFALLVRALWPVKGPAALEQYTRCPDRTARAYASGDREPPAAVLRDLLRGNEGYRVLTWIMDDQPPAWWCEVRHAVAIKRAIEGVMK